MCFYLLVLWLSCVWRIWFSNVSKFGCLLESFDHWLLTNVWFLDDLKGRYVCNCSVIYFQMVWYYDSPMNTTTVFQIFKNYFTSESFKFLPTASMVSNSWEKGITFYLRLFRMESEHKTITVLDSLYQRGKHSFGSWSGLTIGWLKCLLEL